MTHRLAFIAGLLTGILLAAAFWKRSKRETAQPDSPTTEDAKWDKRIDELNSFYSEEKAHSRLGKR